IYPIVLGAMEGDLAWSLRMATANSPAADSHPSRGDFGAHKYIVLRAHWILAAGLTTQIMRLGKSKGMSFRPGFEGLERFIEGMSFLASKEIGHLFEVISIGYAAKNYSDSVSTLPNPEIERCRKIYWEHSFHSHADGLSPRIYSSFNIHTSNRRL